jgi:hypothetical protein
MIRCFHQGDKNLVAAAMALERVVHYSNGTFSPDITWRIGLCFKKVIKAEQRRMLMITGPNKVFHHDSLVRLKKENISYSS